MKISTKYLACILCIMLSALFVSTMSAQVPEEESHGNLVTNYSEVDYRIASGFVSSYQEQIGDSQTAAMQSLNLHAGVSAAIQSAQFAPQYKVAGTFHGVSINYGLKNGNKKVAVILPVNALGIMTPPAGHTKVFVVDLPIGFNDPCPPLCN